MNVETPRCEACDSSYLAWQLKPDCLLWRCPRCGHVQRDLALAQARARQVEYGGDPTADRLRLSLTYRRMRNRLPAGSPRSVLEIGCGTGVLLRRFAADGSHVVGLEPNQGVAPRDLPVHVTPAELLPALGREFDLIYGVHVVEHLVDLAEVLRRCRSALRPGGFIYLLTPNASSLGLRLFEESWWMLEDPTHRRFLSPLSAELLLSRAGFLDVRTRPVVLDSLSVEMASLVRLLGGHRADGVLTLATVRAAAVVASPASLLARVLSPRFAPTMEIIARAPSATRSEVS